MSMEVRAKKEPQGEKMKADEGRTQVPHCMQQRALKIFFRHA